MKTTTPSSAALAQNGSNLGSERSSPLTWPPIAAARRPRRLTPSSSCCAARSGNCSELDAIADEAIGILRDELREPLVLRPDDPVGQVAILDLVPPEAVDAEHLDVDALLVDERDAIGTERAAAALLGVLSALNNRIDFGHGRVGVNVDDPHAACRRR